MEFKPTDYITIGSMFIALLAVIIGPLISLKISRRQTMGPMRVNRIREIRDNLSVFLSLLYTYRSVKQYDIEYDNVEKKKIAIKVFETNFKIKLSLTEDNEIHRQLSKKLDGIVDIFDIEDEQIFRNELSIFELEIIRLSKVIFEDQWEKIKNSK